MSGYTPPEKQKVAADWQLTGVSAARICRKVCERCEVPWEAMFKEDRGLSTEADARALAMYILRVGLGWSQPRTGNYFKRHYTSASTSMERVHNSGPLRREALTIMELLRDEPDYKRPAPGTKTQALIEQHAE